MAYTFSKKVEKPDGRIVVEKVDLFRDLRKAPPPARLTFSIFAAALGAYFIWFGPLAAFGIWRSNLVSPVQVGAIVGLLIFQLSVVWGLKLKPHLGAIVFSIIWSVPTVIAVVSKAGPNDSLNSLIYCMTPAVLALTSGYFLKFFLDRVNMPDRRGGRPVRRF